MVRPRSQFLDFRKINLKSSVYPGPNLTVQEYEASLKPLGTFGTVQVSVHEAVFSDRSISDWQLFRTFGDGLTTCLLLHNSE